MAESDIMKVLNHSFSPPARARCALDVFRADARGVAATEFAIILPVMLTLYLGCAEITKGVMASRKVNLATRAVSDLIAQQPSGTPVDQTTLTNTFNAAKSILAPYSTGTLKITLSGVQAQSKTDGTCCDAKVKWTVVNNGGAARSCTGFLSQVSDTTAPTASNIPKNLVAPTATTTARPFIVVADVKYTYSPGFGHGIMKWNIGSVLNMGSTSYMPPRAASDLSLSGTPTGATICP